MVEEGFSSASEEHKSPTGGAIGRGMMLKARELLNQRRIAEGKEPLFEATGNVKGKESLNEEDDEDGVKAYCRYILQLAYLWKQLGTPPRSGGLMDQDATELHLITVVLLTQDRCKAEFERKALEESRSAAGR